MPAIDPVVLDTSVLVEALLNPSGVGRRAFDFAAWNCDLVTSTDLFEECGRTIFSKKLSSYSDVQSKLAFLIGYSGLARLVPVMRRHRVCADPDDDKLFDLADEVGARYLVSEDKAVLAVKHFRGTQVVSAAAFLRLAAGKTR